MREDRSNPLTFVHECYMIEYLGLTYGHTLVSINEKDIGKQALGFDIKAPIFPTKEKGNL